MSVSASESEKRRYGGGEGLRIGESGRGRAWTCAWKEERSWSWRNGRSGVEERVAGVGERVDEEGRAGAGMCAGRGAEAVEGGKRDWVEEEGLEDD